MRRSRNHGISFNGTQNDKEPFKSTQTDSEPFEDMQNGNFANTNRRNSWALSNTSVVARL